MTVKELLDTFSRSDEEIIIYHKDGDNIVLSIVTQDFYFGDK